MASPQLEDGYLKMANELSEALAKLEVSGREHRVIWAVARLTYGYNKKSDQISYGQISKLTGIDRTNTIKIVNSLVSKMTLGRVKNDTSSRVSLWINKDYDKWIGRVKNDTSVENDTSTRVKNDTKTSVIFDTHQRHKYKKTKPPLPPVEIPAWLDLKIWDDFKAHRKEIKSKMTSKAEFLALSKLEKMKEQGQDPVAVINQSIEMGWKGLFEVKNTNGNKPQQTHPPSRYKMRVVPIEESPDYKGEVH